MSESKKKVDTWYFSVDDALEHQIKARQEIRGTEDEEGEAAEAEETPETVVTMGERKVPVEVFLIKNTDNDAKTPPYPLEKVQFLVTCNQPLYKVKFRIEGTDIECIRAAAWNHLDERFEIEWYDYYKVQVLPARIYEGIGEGMEFNYDTVYKGITWEGKELMKQWRHGYHGGDYKISPWPGRFTNKNGEVIACIPRNDDTEAALVEFGKKIVVMREKLAEFLTPDNIMHTLTGISGLRLLAESNDQLAQEEKEKHERKKNITG